MKKINNIIYSNSKQAVLPMLIQDYLDICDPVLTFDRFMGEIELEKYLKNIYTLMAPSLKQMRINTPGYGKKQLKNPYTVSLVRSLHSLRKSMRNFHVQV